MTILKLFLAFSFLVGNMGPSLAAATAKSLGSIHKCATTLNQKAFQVRLNNLNDVVLNLPPSERNLWINSELDWFDENFLKRTPFITTHPTMGRRMFERSNKEIVTAFETGRRFDNRWVLINGSLFLEGYYRNQRFFEFGHKELDPIQSVLPAQPYFAFDSETQSYNYSRKNAHRELFLFLKNQFSKDDKVTLYRGLGKAQALFLLLIQKLNDPHFAQTEFDSLRAQLTVELNSNSKYKDWNQNLSKIELNTSTKTPHERLNLHKNYLTFFLSSPNWQESLFTTPSLAKATAYADPYVMEASIKMNELKRLIEEQQVYIGVEWEDLELLFYGSDAVASFANKASIKSNLDAK